MRPRCMRGGMTVGTVEHLLATLHAYGVTNALIKVQGEVPTHRRLGARFLHVDRAGGVVEDQGVRPSTRS